ncbi:MAG: hypothetical protein JNG86_19930, partial [Verrucomicrobiaceae bacterium]|nr:hypothetical protein [Verrucomicrobiaceae bacterium]
MKSTLLTHCFRALLAAFFCLVSAVSHAATFTVSNTNDTNAGSLRQAITDALAGGVGPHDIQAGGVTGTISLQSALPTITNSTIRIHGPTSGTLTVTRGVATAFRIFTVNNTGGAASLTVNRMSITNGDGGSTGGNIYVVSSALTLNFCTVSGGASTAFGGGIAIEGTSNCTVNIHACTISGNTGGNGQGGGLYCSDGNGIATHTLNVTDSTFSGNYSTLSAGGGLFVNRTLATLRNCTISGNRAGFNSGGISVGSSGVTLDLINCTIANNTADDGQGGGMRATGTGGSVTNLINTIFVNNVVTGGATAGANDVNLGTGTRTAKNSVVGIHSGTAFSPITASQIGTSASPKVVNLGPLANNGGPTQTHALLASSPELAINLGSNVDALALATDQRGVGYNRLAGGTVDIGAFETGVTAPTFTGVTQLGAPASAVNSNTLSFTVPPGNNRMLLVFAGHADSGAVNFTGVTFGASAMTSAGFKTDGSTAVDSFWTLPLGTSTSATTGTITVTPPAGQEAAHGIIAMAFENVHQTTPTSGFASTNNT